MSKVNEFCLLGTVTPALDTSFPVFPAYNNRLQIINNACGVKGDQGVLILGTEFNIIKGNTLMILYLNMKHEQ